MSGALRERASDRRRVRELLQLGVLAPRIEARRLAPLLCRLPPGLLSTLYDRHKVRAIVAARLDQDSVSLQTVAARLEPWLLAVARRGARVDRGLELLDEIRRNTGVDIGLVKGLVARRLYSDPSYRDLSDFDAYVATVAGAWRCAVALLELDFDFDPSEPPWFKRDEAGVIYGQVRLGRPSDEMWIDFHFGRYSVRHCAVLDISVPAGTGPVTLEENLPALVANAAGDCFTTLKDLNDLYVGIASREIDWDEVRRRLRAVRLDGYFNGMLRRLEALFDLDDLLPEVRALRCPRAYEPAPSLVRGSWHRRWLLTTRHTWQVAAGADFRRRVRITREASRYYRKRLKTRLVEDGAAAAVSLRPNELNSWVCVRAIPRRVLTPDAWPEPDANGGMQRESWGITDDVYVATVDGADILVAGNSTLIPTVYGRVPKRHVGAALRAEPARVTDRG
jgi:Uncharacterised nucleotidyltransferase